MAHSWGRDGVDDFAELMAHKELSKDDLVNLVCESESDKSDTKKIMSNGLIPNYLISVFKLLTQNF